MNDILKIINDPKQLINKTIYIFLFNLFKYIFLKRKKSQDFEKKIEEFIKYINEKIIKDKTRHISKDYSKKNLDNIINFVKTQNQLYAGDIIEGILICTFSVGFSTEQDNTFSKYLYNNLYKIKDPNNYDLVDMFKGEKFYPNELKNFSRLLDLDGTWEDRINEKISNAQDNCVLFNFLTSIFVEKYIHLKERKKNCNSMYYVNRGRLDNQKISDTIYCKLKDNSTTILDKDISLNSIMSLASNLYFPGEFGKARRINIRLIRAFLIQVFIYYQNKNSPLMNYINKDKDGKYDPIPFIYDLRGACVEGRFSLIVLSPLKMEPNISRVSLSQNNLRECGLYEMGKVILFNKNIKTIEFNVSLLRTNFLEFLNNALGIFDNYSVETLNISFNYLKDNCEEYLAKLITYFKGLKTINLNANEFKRGISSFLIVLKNLYRKGKTNLETLFINKCLLDEASYYELGELVKCKYCKLKKLYLNFNTLPSNINFLKKLKKNKSLTQIFINKNEIGNNEVDELLRVISNTEIRYLYLYKNKISSPNKFLSILYRTILIKQDNNNENENEINNNYDNDNDNDNDYDNEIIGDEPYLINLDLSNNELMNKNQTLIKLILTLFKKTTLYCIDISHILYGPSPEKRKITNDNAKYRKGVDDLKNFLEVDKKRYNKVIKDIRKDTVDINRLKDLESEKIFEVFDQKEIDVIISDEKAKFPVFMKQKAAELLNNINNNDIKEIIKEKGFQNIFGQLVNYLTVKRAEKELKELVKTRKAKKLILI